MNTRISTQPTSARRGFLYLFVLVAIVGIGSLSLGGCDIDGRYHRCEPNDDCGRDDQGRTLFCACDGICRAKCKVNPANDADKCRAGERCVVDFCVHDNEPDVKLGVKCENKGEQGGCAFGVMACNNNNKMICRVSSKVGEEVCDGVDNDCNGKIDDNLVQRCSNACGNGFQRCNGGKWDLCDAEKSRVCESKSENCDDGIEYCREGKWTGICEGAVKPSKEECNGRDDDCDGTIDEDTERDCTNTCGKGKEICVAGKYLACNAKGLRPCGNDKGECKAGVQSCSDDKWGECKGAIGGSSELCDGLDNDCNGQIDESWSRLYSPCEAGVGECRSIGVFRCAPDRTSVVCTATAKPASVEICDGKDNDCDGQTDEGLDKPCQNICGSGFERCVNGKFAVCDATKARVCGPRLVAPCTQGAELCLEGKWTGACVGQVKPGKETCNGKDDDCDGAVDEDFPGANSVCFAPGIGECAAPGRNVCNADGTGTFCNAKPIPPKPETCNTKDDDCDGLVDNLKPVVLSNHTSTISDVVYSPSGRQLATASIDGKVFLWDRNAIAPTIFRTLNHPGPVYAVAYGPLSKRVITGAADNKVRVWDSNTGQLLLTLSGHTGIVTRVGFDRFGQVIYSASADNSIKLWLATTGKLLQTLNGHSAPVYGAAIGLYTNVFASGGNDKKGLLWNLGRGTSSSFWNVNATINAMRFDSVGLDLLVAASDGRIRRYSVIDVDILGHRFQQANLSKTYTYHKQSALRIAVHPNRNHIFASSGADNDIALWQKVNSQPIRVFKGHTNAVRAISFHPTRNEFASGGDDQKVHIYTCFSLP